MQREEFETRIRELLPGASKMALDRTVSYAEELEREAEECAGSLYDAFYVELALVKRDHGAEIAKALFDYGEHFTFNFFELRGAARLLAQGWSLEKIEAYTVENGCDAAPEEALESRSALQAFQNGDPNFLEVPETEMGPEMR